VTIIKVVGPEELQVLTSGGDRFLGGADFDADISEHFVQRFERKHGVDLKKIGDLKTDQDFRDKAELAKIDLSADTQVDVSLPAAGKVLDLTLKRTEFETLIKHHIEQTKGLTEEGLKAAKLDWPDLDKVLLVGGSTRIPMVREMIMKLTGRAPETGINPDEVVAMGAAIHAANRTGMMVRNEKGQKLAQVRFRNVTAHALGIIALDEGKRDVNSRIIEKDAEIPVQCTKAGYTTEKDNQTAVRLQVIQGEDEDPAHCIKVGEAVLDGIPAMPNGKPKIDVTLGYDESGIVQLHAKELTSGREIRAQLKCPGLMSEAEVQQSAERVGRLKVT
jgi:molecular chaperone DnaK